MLMLDIKNLSKKYGPTLALEDFSLEIKEGEIYSLIGPNGSGKTTLVKLIAGLLYPTSGSISIMDYDIVKNPENAKARTGYIPDEPSVWPYMSGEEFIYFTQALFGMNESDGAKEKMMQDLLKIFSLAGLEKQYFNEYSRGNKQKFSILAALSHNPKLLLVDEPIVGLDPASAEIAKALFVDFAKKGGAVLLVTHTLSVAEEISNRIGILSKGRLIAAGTLAELRNLGHLDSASSLEVVYKKIV
jgi:ABC-2 type transport system ATP-binding protein